MASLREMRKRIGAVKSIRQITKAMKMVAAARLRKAEERLRDARPYARRIHEVLSDVAAREDLSGHPLLSPSPGGKGLLLVITSDRGLCGSFNANILRRAMRFLDEADRPTEVLVVGKKGRDFFRRRKYKIRREWVEVFRDMKFETAIEVRDALVDPYLEGEVGRVDLCYNEFKSAMTQRVVVERLLPIEPAEVGGGARPTDFEYLPDMASVFEALVPKYFAVQVWASFLESFAAEMGARMTSMDSATNNATEMIEHLTLVSNRLRQAQITKELSEIVGGAEALTS